MNDSALKRSMEMQQTILESIKELKIETHAIRKDLNEVIIKDITEIKIGVAVNKAKMGVIASVSALVVSAIVSFGGKLFSSS